MIQCRKSNESNSPLGIRDPEECSGRLMGEIIEQIWTWWKDASSMIKQGGRISSSVALLMILMLYDSMAKSLLLQV